MKTKLKRFASILCYIHELEPKVLLGGITASILEAVKPFVAMIISKILIEAVLVKTDYIVLLRQILIMLTGYLFLSVLGGFFDKRNAYHFCKFQRKHEIRKADHLLNIPYAWTENDDMQQRIAELATLERKNVFGFGSQNTHIRQASGAIIGLVLATVLVVDIFTRGVSLGVMPAWVLDIGFAVIFVTLFSLTLKIVAWINTQYGKAIGQESAPLARHIKSYDKLIYQYKSGKDIRLFSKNLAKDYTKVYRNYMEKMFTLLSDLFTKNITIETFMAALSNGFIYIYVAIKALKGGIRISEIVLFIGAFTQLTHHAIELIDSISMLRSEDLYREKLLAYYALGKGDVSASTDRCESVMNAGTSAQKVRKNEATVSDASTFAHEIASASASDIIGKPLTTMVAHSCQIIKLSFQYPGSEKKVLNDISFRIRQVEKLAIVGENGSGKSTLIKLLVGLYHEYDGDILLGDRNAQCLPEDVIGKFFAPVFQDFRLLAFTLRDNVTCFAEIPDAQTKETLECVGMKEFYDAHGLDAFLTRSFEGTGVEVSGGEAQKIAMARAMLKGAPIFVLDEPTAALDPISEREIYEKFNEIIEGKTAIFISHRLSSCKFCDRILVLDKGKLVQIGSHDELLQDVEGKYSELWNAQARHYTNISVFEK